MWILIGQIAIGIGLVFIAGLGIMLIRCFRKVEQGTAIIRTGMGETRVSFSGIVIFPIIHRLEMMDISVKRIEIDRAGVDGLICCDNLRADVKVAFFVRVNKTPDDVLKVAQCLGCVRGSDPRALIEFFDAKFSEALKTVGKKFNFVDLYTNREQFKEAILGVIGTDLNGYVLDDAAIDYLEQTKLDKLDPKNILDAEGIKKITELTAQQAILANDIERDKQKIIKKQDVEAREAILELERQQVDAEQKQQREIAEVSAREQAEAMKVQEEERLKAERARIQADEEIAIADENRQRQVIVAARNKERTDAVESERVMKDRDLEMTERERVVELARIEKEKAIEIERKNIQEVIRERVTVERSVVEEEEKIKDTREFATAERSKQVAVLKASEEAEQELIRETKAAEASREAARYQAEQVVIEADAERTAAEKQGDARKILADAKAEEEAVIGVGEARALEARAAATELFGTAEAQVIERKATAEATGIERKAEAMKIFDAVGKEHEEFKLQLNKELEIELAGINVQKDIAAEHAQIVGEALKHSHIDIVGGETTFFDRIVNAVGQGKAVDRLIDNSSALTDIRRTLFTGDSSAFTAELKRFAGQFGITSEDLKNLTVSALLTKLSASTDDAGTLGLLKTLGEASGKLGLSDKIASKVLGKSA